ncbi:MAG: hypothetical protein LC115_03480 [Bacteroidia bacterium]|nr:hypothetical protein [Bacteroidia bacterium]
MRFIFFICCFVFIAFFNTRGQSHFGLKIATTLYQPRIDIPLSPPGAGIEVGGCAKFTFGKWHLMPEFGYFMGNSRSIQSNIIVSGGLVVNDAGVRDLQHFLSFSGLWKFDILTEEKLSFTIGPDLLYRIGVTRIVDYVPPGGDPDHPFRESFKYDISNINKTILNIRLGLEFALTSRKRIQTFIYANSVHQVNKYLFPTGAVVGIKAYYHKPTKS